MFLTTFYVLQKWPYIFTIIASKPLGAYKEVFWGLLTLVNCSPRFVTLDATRKIGPNTFVTVKTAIFWNIFFYRPLRSQRIELIISTIKVKKPSGPLLCVPWRLSYLIIREIMCQFNLFQWKDGFFSENCVFDHLSGVTERIFYLKQWSPDNLVQPKKRVPETWHAR